MRRMLLVSIAFALCTCSGLAQNVLLNPGFESGLAPWSGGASISAARFHAGLSSAYFDATSDYAEQIVTLTADSTYRLSAWVYLDSSFAGNDWGGVLLSATHYDWSGQYASEFLSPLNRPIGEWFHEYLEFSPTHSQLRIRAAMFGGSGWVPRFYVDDVSLVQLNGANQPPEINSVTISPLSGAAPLLVSVSANIADPDGVVRLIQHHFGDGSESSGISTSHTYSVAGSYTYSMTAVDDQGASSTWQQMIIVTEPGAPFVEIQLPTGDDSCTVSDSVISIGGTFSSAVTSASWHNRRTAQSGPIALQSSFTTQYIRLEPGENWIDVQVRLPGEQIRSDATCVHYFPAGYAGPIISNITAPAGNVGQYDLWELEFDLKCAATAPTLPYDPQLPLNLRGGTGVTVDAVFTNGAQTIRWPAFLKAQATRHSGHFVPTGTSVWCVRAAFREAGVWTCVIEARDEFGLTTTSGPTVVVEPSDDKGYLRVSENDDRYFEFENGDLFLPMGFGFPLTNADDMDEELRRWRENGINFSRLWLSSESPFTDPWCSFATHHPMTDNGYMPPPLLTTHERFADGDVSWELGAPAQSGVHTPAIFRGFWHGAVRVQPGTNYRVTARVKTVNVTGTGGLVLKTGGWLGESVIQPGVGQVVTPYLKGSNNWCYLQGDFATAANQYELPNLYVVLENVSSGQAFVDELLLQEVRSDGTLSESILPKPNANSHYYMDGIRSLDYDYLVQAACTSGVYFKLVIAEKDDRLLNMFDDFGYVNPFDGAFETARGSKSRRLMEYYWRHLIARYGYAVSVHSWELINEGAPYSYVDLTNHLAAFMDSAGPYPRMVTTSFWAGWQPDYWNASLADYGDVHAYVMTTGWIDSISIDGLGYNRTMLKEDPAAAVFAYSKQIADDPLRTKPVIIAETDLDMPGDQSPDPRLARDTSGLWLHDFIWGHINSGGVSALIWNKTNILANDLHGEYLPFTRFCAGLELHKRGYRDLAATTSSINLRAWGQRDSLGLRAHLWIKNRLHTWANVLEHGPASPVTGTILIPSMHSGSAIVTRYNTDTGVAFEVDTVLVGLDGTTTISVQDLQNDVAVTIENIESVRPLVEGVTIAPEANGVTLRWQAVDIPCSYRIWYSLNASMPFEAMSLAATSTAVLWTDSALVQKKFYVVECVPQE